MRIPQSRALSLALIAALALPIAGCARNRARTDLPYVARDVGTLYTTAKNRLDQGRFKEAALLFTSGYVPDAATMNLAIRRLDRVMAGRTVASDLNLSVRLLESLRTRLAMPPRRVERKPPRDDRPTRRPVMPRRSRSRSWNGSVSRKARTSSTSRPAGDTTRGSSATRWDPKGRCTPSPRSSRRASRRGSRPAPPPRRT